MGRIVPRNDGAYTLSPPVRFSRTFVTYEPSKAPVGIASRMRWLTVGDGQASPEAGRFTRVPPYPTLEPGCTLAIVRRGRQCSTQPPDPPSRAPRPGRSVARGDIAGNALLPLRRRRRGQLANVAGDLPDDDVPSPPLLERVQDATAGLAHAPKALFPAFAILPFPPTPLAQVAHGVFEPCAQTVPNGEKGRVRLEEIGRLGERAARRACNIAVQPLEAGALVAQRRDPPGELAQLRRLTLRGADALASGRAGALGELGERGL